MQLSQSKTKELMVILSPDRVDRNTEQPFTTLFEKPPVFVIPPHLSPPDHENPIPHKDSVLLFEGGNDVNPVLYKQQIATRTQLPDTKRDAHEAHYFQLAQDVSAACVGICRGAQFLCVMSGGSLIQDVLGHNGNHPLELPDKYRRFRFKTTSTHHQIMNPYVLPAKEWTSYGTADVGYRYRDEYNNKIKVKKRWKGWQDQEIVWFKKTRSLAIQGHPEYYQSFEAPFVLYCRFLVNFLICGDDALDGIQTP